MSKLIVEMDMPQTCAECQIGDYFHTNCPLQDDDKSYEQFQAYKKNERPSWCPIKGEISDIELMHLEEERAFAARNIAAESEADADYQLSVLMQEYFERYEPTYNSEDGSM